MPANTPSLGVPYPLPEDALVDYPALGQELAEKIEELVAPAWTYRNTPIETAAQSFAASGPLLPQDIALTADGETTYLARFAAPGWKNDTVGNSLVLSLSVDNLDAGMLVFHTEPAAGAYLACAGAIIVTPAAGAHTVNVRPYVGGGTMTLLGGPAGPGAQGPMLFTVEAVRPFGILVAADEPLPAADVDLAPLDV